ncbi:MAG: M28 family metallopeptidase [Promethearchaeota archaeon]
MTESGIDGDVPDELGAGASYELGLISRVIEATGPRLPTSPEERRAAEMVRDEFSRVTGREAVLEEFTCHPYASIGFIPVLGYILLLVLTPLYLFAPLYAFVGAIFLFTFAIVQIFRYRGWFDFLFPKGTSQNVYAVVEPPSGRVDFTLVINGHVDSSWHTRPFAKNPGRAAAKLTYAVLSGVVILVLALVNALSGTSVLNWGASGGPHWTHWLYLSLVGLVPGFVILASYMTWDKERASPGAMDDLSGVAVAAGVVRHLLSNPGEYPENCRLVLAAFGSEEAGLKGSHAFVEAHRDDLLSGDAWVLIVDGVCDYDHFLVIDGDAWLGTNYDDDFCTLAEEAYKAAGVEYKRMKNPAGATDGASFARAGIRTVAMVAQDPTPSDNYHTCKDTVERLDPRTIVKMREVCLELVSRVAKFAMEHGGRK